MPARPLNSANSASSIDSPDHFLNSDTPASTMMWSDAEDNDPQWRADRIDELLFEAELYGDEGSFSPTREGLIEALNSGEIRRALVIRDILGWSRVEDIKDERDYVLALRECMAICFSLPGLTPEEVSLISESLGAKEHEIASVRDSILTKPDEDEFAAPHEGYDDFGQPVVFH